MKTPLSTIGLQKTGRCVFVTESEERLLARIRGLFDLDNPEASNRAWASLGRKDAACLMISMMLTVLFDEDVVYKLREDLSDCCHDGCTNPTIIVCSEMEGGAS